jgi:GNAT superfamily N-acetyltransferase
VTDTSAPEDLSSPARGRLVVVEPGRPTWNEMIEVLTAAGLPTDDVGDPGQRFFQIANTRAFGGFALADGAILLRSIAVDPTLRQTGVGSALLDDVLDEARAAGARDAWLLTTTAAGFFARHGFRPVDRALVPGVVSGSRQFKGLCPASACLMWMSLIGPRS